MAGLVPAIHVFVPDWTKDVDARHEAGHDERNRKTLDFIGFISRSIAKRCVSKDDAMEVEFRKDVDASTVIARSASDEAIHASACRAMDCFARARNDGLTLMSPLD